MLVDYARRPTSNEGRATEPLDDLAIADAYGEAADLLALRCADWLSRRNELAARIVELRFFAGMAHEEIAAVCHTPLRTVERTFRLARATLLRYLREPPT
ncbi:MAG: ECF-type sigma factor [Nannocystaceae bacterium]